MDDHRDAWERSGARVRGPRAVDGEPTDSGFSMVVTTISLLITALLVLFALTTMFKSSNGSTKLSNQPGVGLADDLQAQQSLQTTLTTASALAAEAGAYSDIT